MGKTRYARLTEFLSKLKAEKGSLIKPEIFRAAFIVFVGNDTRTMRDCNNMMKELNMIELTEDGILIR